MRTSHPIKENKNVFSFLTPILLMNVIVVSLLGLPVHLFISADAGVLEINTGRYSTDYPLKIGFGYPWSPVPNPDINIGELRDNSYTFTGVDTVYTNHLHYDDLETVVIIMVLAKKNG